MNTENKEQQTKSIIGYQSAVGVGVVAAVFTLFIVVLLGINVYHMFKTDPARLNELEVMKEQAKLDPTDEALADKILP